MRYHNWIHHMLRKEREMEKQLELFNVTNCDYCGELIHAEDVVVKVYHTCTSTEQAHFCTTACHAEWYIRRLRTWGM